MMVDSSASEMPYKRYLEILRDEEYLELYDYYSKETMMDILGVSRQENPHSSFVRWILDIHGGHGMGEIPMRKFMETVCLFHDKAYCKENAESAEKTFWNNKDNIFSPCNRDFLNKIRYGRYDIVEQSIAKELVLQGQRRADIFAVLKLHMQDGGDEYKYLILLIENKVHSQEHTDASKGIGQTEAYVEDLSDNKKLNEIIGKMEEEWIDREVISSNTFKMFVYLNASHTESIKEELRTFLDKGQKKNDSACFARSKEFISLNYQYLLDGVIEPTFKMTTDSIANQRLYDYIRCLGQAKISAVDERRSGRKQLGNEYLIMAVSGREKLLAQSLWYKYFDIICRVIESLGPINSGEGFIINENDRDFWISLSNLYRMIDLGEAKSDDEKQARSKLKEIVEDSNKVHNSRKHKFIFKGNEYESFKARSVGLLCRDIIADYILKIEKGEQQKEALTKLRNEVLGWHPNWLREVILFDNEIDEICRNNQCDVENCRYHTNGLEDFAGAFFSYLDILVKNNKKNENFVLPKYDRNYQENTPYPLEIKLRDGKKAYVAKFWGADDLQGLIQYMDEQGDCRYRDQVEQKY